MKRVLAGSLLLGCLFAPCAMAADAYQVELIVFRQNSPAGNEVWPPLQLKDLPDTAAALNLETAPQATALPASRVVTGQEPARFVLLDPSAYQLQGTWDALARNDRYEPLLHIAWQQPGLDEPDVQAVRVQMGQPVALTLQPDEGAAAPAAVFADPGRYPPATTTESNAAQQAAPVLYSPLDGTATLTVNFYMFLQLDLVFTPTPPVIGAGAMTPATVAAPAANDQAVLEALARGELTLEQAQAMRAPAADEQTGDMAEKSLNGYRLRESRRLKLNEINYFDNPAFGVIAQVRPIDIPDEAETGN